MNQAKRAFQAEKKNTGKRQLAGQLGGNRRAREKNVQEADESTGWIMLSLAHPRMTLSPMSKGRPLKFLHKEQMGNITLAAVQILRADACLSEVYKLILTLLQTHEVHS